MGYGDYDLDQIAENEFDPWESDYTGESYRLVLETYDKDGEWTDKCEPVSGYYANSNDCYRFSNSLVRSSRDVIKDIIQDLVWKEDREARLFIETEWFEEGESVGGEHLDQCAVLRFFWRNEKLILQWKQCECVTYNIND